MMDFKVEVKQVVPGHWEWRVVHPNGQIAKSSTQVYASESEARDGAERTLTKLSHDSGWNH